jgi:SAM-dependent methyltransferase
VAVVCQLFVQVLDAGALPFPDGSLSLDVVLWGAAMHYCVGLPDAKAAMQEILKPGGILYAISSR